MIELHMLTMSFIVLVGVGLGFALASICDRDD